MENLETKLSEAERQRLVYERAVASIERERHTAPAAGHAVMASFLSYGEASTGDGWFAKVSHAAKLFMILFGMLAPSLLVWQVLLK